MFDRKIKLFRLLGFEVGIDPSWIILAILVAWSLSTGFFPFRYRNLPVQTYWIMGIIGAVGLFASIIAHEFCHSLVARKSGMPMKGITLFIFGGVAEMGDEPPSAKDEFMIAAVGPLSSFVMAGIFYSLNSLGTASGWSVPVSGILVYLGMINVFLAVFNLLPAFPLDGGRILRSILWKWKGNLKWATRVSSQIGSGLGIALIVLGVLRVISGFFIGGMWLFLIGLFIRSAAKMSYQQLITRRALEGEPLRRFMNTDPVTVPPSLTLDQLVDDYVYRHHFKMYPVVDGDRLIGCVSMKQIKTVPREEWSRKKVGELAADCAPENTVSPDVDAVDLLSSMRRDNTSRLMVVENGRLLGIISLKDMLKFLSLKIELEQI